MTATAAEPAAATETFDVVIIGAGPAGLATAGALRQQGISALVVDRAAQLGASWRGHYDRLHLHTVRWLSGLPGLAIPASEGKWVSRDGVVRYLEAYTRHHNIQVRTGFEVTGLERDQDHWRITSPSQELHAKQVVVGTGYNHTPEIPDWPGRETFTGEIKHAREYKNGKPYTGKDVLVVGAGNTGAEIAVDLTEHGARTVWLAYRRPPYVVFREQNGIPAQAISIVMSRVPTPIANRMAEVVRHRAVPDLTPYGLPDPGPGVYTRAKRGEIPILDVGLIEAIQNRKVTPVPAVIGFEQERVNLRDHAPITPDAVIVATGYRRGLEPLIGQFGMIAANGRPTVHDEETHPAAPGLRFLGYTNPLGGMFRQIAIDARKIAKAIKSELTTEVGGR